MRAISHLLIPLALLTLMRSVMAQEPDLTATEIKVSKVSGNIYLLQGADAGNMAALIGEDGIVLIDDEYAPLAERISAALRKLADTDQPVRFVINTHYHYDHTGGNAPFAVTGATLIAHDNVRTRLRTGGPAGNGSSILFEEKPRPPGALPVITFDHDVSVHLNGEDIRALHFPAGHTDGDSVIFFPKNNVVHMGDDYVRYGFPFIDVEAGGSVQGMIRACEATIAQVPADVKVIPGHGELSTIGEMQDYVRMLKGTSAAVAAALKGGKSVEQMKRENVLAAWSARYSSDNIDTNGFIETLYNSLTGQRRAPYLKHN